MKGDAGRGKLCDAQKTLRAKWEETAETWTDTVRAEFEEHVWLPLDQYTSEGLRAIDRLARILTECRRACSGSE